MKALEVGKLYKWDGPGSIISVFITEIKKIPPIYTQFKFIIMGAGIIESRIVDKFHLESFYKDFTEVTEEKKND